jgi:hypothetical protein
MGEPRMLNARNEAGAHQESNEVAPHWRPLGTRPASRITGLKPSAEMRMKPNDSRSWIETDNSSRCEQRDDANRENREL